MQSFPTVRGRVARSVERGDVTTYYGDLSACTAISGDDHLRYFVGSISFLMVANME